MFLLALALGHDLVVRAALGAPRLRLALPALAEGWLVGGVGTLLGLGMAVAGLDALQRFMPDQWLVGGTLKLGAGSWLLGSMLGLFGALTGAAIGVWRQRGRSEEHTSELQSLMRISYAVFCLKKKT